MEKIKTFKLNKDVFSSANNSADEYSLYLLSDEEQKETNAEGKYLLHKTFSDSELEQIGEKTLIKRTISMQDYLGWGGVFETAKEAELRYQLDILMLEIRTFEKKFSAIYDAIHNSEV